MERLLLTYATRPFSIRVAQLLSERFEIVFATSDEIPLIFKERYNNIPKGINPTYAHEVLKMALDKDCTYILPMGIDEIGALSESLVLFEEYGITICCPGITHLKEMSVIENPGKELALSLLIAGDDILKDTIVLFPFNGLGLVSDSGESFILTVAK